MVEAYHRAFVSEKADAARLLIGSQLWMSGGAGSAEASDWEAHMFLRGEEIDQWLGFMMKEAGPFVNEVEVLSTHERAQAALVVTRETGRNKFREWSGEVVVWQLGQVDGSWKILGFFLSDARNPE
ncbi:hypothetical protein ABI59_19245 [Acidobacteria bacterium Mor1]|nr:hypothetical protein ABI59_19245 [Acidobacteria bacterium Mor1]